MATKNTNKHAYFHVLLRKMGIKPDDKRDFIIDYTDGITDNLTELHEKYPAFYADMIRHMQGVAKQINDGRKSGEMDKLRKQVIASIGGYYRLIGQGHDIDYIKATACRATEYNSFNAIPKERLRNIYSAFKRKQDDFKAVGKITGEHLRRSALLN